MEYTQKAGAGKVPAFKTAVGKPKVEILHESRGLTGTGSPYKIIAVGLTGAVAQWERASLARKRPGVRIPPAPPDFARLVRLLLYNESGRSAVWLAHLLWEQGVEGSNPFAPTIETGAGIAQLARAMAFQAVGRGFESRFPLHFSGACSSVGQSNGLLSRGSRVRILPGAPVENMVSVVQLVRALDCGSRCWGFKSPRSPQKQMSARSSVDRVTDFGSVGRGFESCRARHIKVHFGLLAQLVEQLTLNQRVVGSSPSQSTIKIKVRKAFKSFSHFYFLL